MKLQKRKRVVEGYAAPTCLKKRQNASRYVLVRDAFFFAASRRLFSLHVMPFILLILARAFAAAVRFHRRPSAAFDACRANSAL
jgi:hypothetical protein